MTPMTVVVTGSESFVGRALIPALLAADRQVVAIDTIQPRLDGGVAVDIRSRQLADCFPEGAEAVVHLAAISRDRDCAADPVTAYDVNVSGTANVLQAARARGISQVVFASTEWVYGDVGDQESQPEDSVLDVHGALNEYAATKVAGEMALAVAVKRGLAAGTILRFGIIYAPRPSNWSAVESLVNSVRTLDEVAVGSKATARRFIHVDDIASGIVASLGHPGFDIFNLAGDELVTLGRVLGLACEASGRSPTIVEKDPAAASVRNPVSDKAKSVLAWEPAVSIEAGVRGLNDYFAAAGSTS